MRSRIRLIMPKGSAAAKRVAKLVRAQGGRVLRVQEWLSTNEVSVAEILILLKNGSAGSQLRISLEEAGLMVLDMHPIGKASRAGAP